MYCVVGSDGQVYGPVDAPTLQEWVREGRIVPTTMLIDANTQQHVLAADVRAIQPLLYSTPVAPPPGAMPPGPTPPGYYRPPQSSPYFQHSGAPPRDKTAAILLGVFTGIFGGHRFYLGHYAIGAVQLSLSLLGVFCCFATFVTLPIVAVWALVETIMIACNALPDAEGRIPT